jgi:hypothetical protein
MGVGDKTKKVTGTGSGQFDDAVTKLKERWAVFEGFIF